MFAVLAHNIVYTRRISRDMIVFLRYYIVYVSQKQIEVKVIRHSALSRLYPSMGIPVFFGHKTFTF